MLGKLVMLHVGAGSIAILGMVTAWVTQKGGKLHRLSGKTFVVAMMLSLLAGLLVAVLTKNILLILIALFTGYLVYTGWRLVRNHDTAFSMLDRLLMFDMLIVGACMLGFGSFWLVAGNQLGVVLLFLGVFASAPAIQDLMRKRMWPTGKERIVLHLIRMGSASIATLTAVLVVNVQTEPVYIAWLLPTVIFTPLIAWFSSQTRKRKNRDTDHTVG